MKSAVAPLVLTPVVPFPAAIIGEITLKHNIAEITLKHNIAETTLS